MANIVCPKISTAKLITLSPSMYGRDFADLTESSSVFLTTLKQRANLTSRPAHN